MDPADLVNQALQLLAPLLPLIARPGHAGGTSGQQAGRVLYDLVASVMHEQGLDDALTAFTSNPADSFMVRKTVTAKATADVDFARRLADAVRRAQLGPSPTTVTQTHNVAGGHIVGRDMVTKTDNSTTHSSRTVNTGGVVIAVMVVAVVLIVVFVGRAVLNAASSSGLNGSSTCAQWLSSADDAGKVSLMKQLYLNAGKPHDAADPFIVQNTDYFCGGNPHMTLSQLAASRSD